MKIIIETESKTKHTYRKENIDSTNTQQRL